MVSQTLALRRNMVIRGTIKVLGLISAMAGVMFFPRADMKGGELSTIDSDRMVLTITKGGPLTVRL